MKTSVHALFPLISLFVTLAVLSRPPAAAAVSDPAAAINVSLNKANSAATNLRNLYNGGRRGGSATARMALNDCIELMDDCRDYTLKSLNQMKKIAAGTVPAKDRGFQMSNVMTWMSSALTDENTCLEGFNDVADASLKSAVEKIIAAVQPPTSEALRLVNDFAKKIAVP